MFIWKKNRYTHVSAHRIDTMVLSTIDIVLVTEDADGHTCDRLAHACATTLTPRRVLTRTRHGGELDGSGETLVTLGIVVLEADLELDSLEKVSLLGLVGVLKELLDVATNAGNRDFRHDWRCVSQRIFDSFGGSGAVMGEERPECGRRRDYMGGVGKIPLTKNTRLRWD